MLSNQYKGDLKIDIFYVMLCKKGFANMISSLQRKRPDRRPFDDYLSDATKKKIYEGMRVDYYICKRVVLRSKVTR